MIFMHQLHHSVYHPTAIPTHQGLYIFYISLGSGGACENWAWKQLGGMIGYALQPPAIKQCGIKNPLPLCCCTWQILLEYSSDNLSGPLCT
jgi:hypothetical protein